MCPTFPPFSTIDGFRLIERFKVWQYLKWWPTHRFTSWSLFALFKSVKSTTSFFSLISFEWIKKAPETIIGEEKSDKMKIKVKWSLFFRGPVINAMFEKCVRAVAKEKGTVVDLKSTTHKKVYEFERYSIMLKLLKNKKFDFFFGFYFSWELMKELKKFLFNHWGL